MGLLKAPAVYGHTILVGSRCVCVRVCVCVCLSVCRYLEGVVTKDQNVMT
jgi:hypothetical protein